MKPYKSIANNPGLRNKPWGIVGVEWDAETNTTSVKSARQFRGENLNVISDYIYRIHNDVKPDIHTIEINGSGNDIYLKLMHSLRSFGWLRPFITTGKITEKIRGEERYMDKPYMVGWLKTQKKLGNILFPENPQGDMRELERQMNEFVSITTPNGYTCYKRMCSRKDDLIMALMMACCPVMRRSVYHRFN